MASLFFNNCGNGARKQSRIGADDLPTDLFIEILQRLPLRPLFRCTAVSKLWRELVQLAHAQRKTTPAIDFALLAFNSFGSLNEACRSHLLQPEEDSHVHMTQHFYHNLLFSDACNGFWLLHDSKSMDKVYVGNPLTSNKPVQLPLIQGHGIKRNKRYCFNQSMLAFDPKISPHYKVVMMHNYHWPTWSKNGDKLFSHSFVYSSKTRVWSELDSTLYNSAKGVWVLMPGLLTDQVTICFDGKAYRLATSSTSRTLNAVVSFDIEKEQFQYIGHPALLSHIDERESGRTKLAVADGSLQYVHCNSMYARIWKLNEVNNNGSQDWTWRRKINMFDVFWTGNFPLDQISSRRCNNWDDHYYEGFLFMLHGNEEVLYFVDNNGCLCCYNIKEKEKHLIGNVESCVVGKDSPPPTLIPFVCCAIDPEKVTSAPHDQQLA